MRRMLTLCICLALVSFGGVLLAATETGAISQKDGRTYDIPPAECTPELEDGDTPVDGGRVFVETVDANSTAPNYAGPFVSNNPCQSFERQFGFDHLGWYDNDFGWKHTFNPYTGEPGTVCFHSATLLVCAWDVDQISCNREHANDPGFCQRDRIFADGQALLPAILDGSNYEWFVTPFVVPMELLEDGELDIWADIDAFADHCNWATVIHHSQLVITYSLNEAPYQPELFAECTTEQSPLCIYVIVPSQADPDGDNVTYSFKWYLSNEGTNHEFVLQPDLTEPCVTTGLYHEDDIWRAEVTATDPCGLSASNFLDVTIVNDCNPEPPPDGYDYGDLDPTCYPTSLSGPANPVYLDNVAWLGESVTIEQAPNTVNLDGADDGVVFLFSDNRDFWTPCEEACVDVTITTGPGYEDQPLYLYAWKDGNLNCSFADTLCDGNAPEAIIPGVLVTPGTHQFCFPDPGQMIGQGRYDGVFRFRLLSEHVSLDTALFSIDPLLGETEDYVKEDLQLPVELLSFTAVLDGQSVLLSWVTASEQDNDHFIIERHDGAIWQRIASDISAVGQSTVRTSYQFRDEAVEMGATYDYRLIAVDINGHSAVLSTTGVLVTESDPSVISEYRLYTNYPNPFNPSTTITFDIKEAGHVGLIVYDVMGREVAVLHNETMAAGRHHEVFDATGLPSGLYVYRLTTNDFSDMKKMILLK
ncbi:MAG: T9SS type A sorting domain-containing protein [bacterium]|nr:T9SS type A sorting domain-containing protein [bacterium]